MSLETPITALSSGAIKKELLFNAQIAPMIKLNEQWTWTLSLAPNVGNYEQNISRIYARIPAHILLQNTLEYTKREIPYTPSIILLNSNK